MARDLAWVDGLATGRLALMARPRAGEWLEDEIAGWARAGVSTVVSLLEPREESELGLSGEAGLCAAQGLEFVSFPVPDRGLPASRPAVAGLVDRLHERLLAGDAVAIHCRAGVGRTGVVAGCLLLRMGEPFRGLFDRLSRARGVRMPDTPEQESWVRTFGEYRPGTPDLF